MQETRVHILSQEGPLENQMVTRCTMLAWEIHGQWSLAGYGPWGPREVRHDLVTTQQHLLVFSGQWPRIQIKPAVSGPHTIPLSQPRHSWPPASEELMRETPTQRKMSLSLICLHFPKDQQWASGPGTANSTDAGWGTCRASLTIFSCVSTLEHPQVHGPLSISMTGSHRDKGNLI